MKIKKIILVSGALFLAQISLAFGDRDIREIISPTDKCKVKSSKSEPVQSMPGVTKTSKLKRCKSSKGGHYWVTQTTLTKGNQEILTSKTYHSSGPKHFLVNKKVPMISPKNHVVLAKSSEPLIAPHAPIQASSSGSPSTQVSDSITNMVAKLKSYLGLGGAQQ